MADLALSGACFTGGVFSIRFRTSSRDGVFAMSNLSNLPKFTNYFASFYDIPAADTPEGQERERAYYEALGRFVQMFAEVEKVLSETLWGYAGTIPAISKIVFAGAASDQTATYIKACAKAFNATQDTQDDLENVLQQFGIIRGVRNDILHYGAEFIAEGRGTVSNAWKAKAEPVEFAISATDLAAMEIDLRKVIAHLGYRHLGRAMPRSAAGRRLLDRTLQSPWLYKRPQPPRINQGEKGTQKPRRK